MLEKVVLMSLCIGICMSLFFVGSMWRALLGSILCGEGLKKPEEVLG